MPGSVQRKLCPITQGLWICYQASEAFYGIQVTDKLLSILLIIGLVKMTLGLVSASYSLPRWQAVNMTFFAPCKPWGVCTMYLLEIYAGIQEHIFFVWYVESVPNFSNKKRCQNIAWSLPQVSFQTLFNHEVHKQDLMINSSYTILVTNFLNLGASVENWCLY